MNMPTLSWLRDPKTCGNKHSSSRIKAFAGLVAGYVLLKEHQISKNKEQKMAFSTPIKEHLIPILAEARDNADTKFTLQVEEILSF